MVYACTSSGHSPLKMRTASFSSSPAHSPLKIRTSSSFSYNNSPKSRNSILEPKHQNARMFHFYLFVHQLNTIGKIKHFFSIFFSFVSKSYLRRQSAFPSPHSRSASPTTSTAISELSTDSGKSTCRGLFQGLSQGGEGGG